MQHSEVNVFKVLFGWLFIATIGLTASGKTFAATYKINWRTTSPSQYPTGEAVLSLLQESSCGKQDKAVNFCLTPTTLDPKWTTQMTHAQDASTKDRQDHCRARSKVTVAITQKDVNIRIRLNNLCSDETCSVKDVGGSFSCGVVHAPEKTNQFFSINDGNEIKCTR